MQDLYKLTLITQSLQKRVRLLLCWAAGVWSLWVQSLCVSVFVGYIRWMMVKDGQAECSCLWASLDFGVKIHHRSVCVSVWLISLWTRLSWSTGREHPESVHWIVLFVFVNETDDLTELFLFLPPQRDDRSPACGPPSFSSPPFGLKPRSGELALG